jgi:hypothetical protein
MATNNIEKQSFGQAGATMRSGTEAIEKDICAILVIEDAVLDATGTIWGELTDTGVGGKTLKGGVTLPAGITIYGQFSKVTLDSGTVLCYHAA